GAASNGVVTSPTYDVALIDVASARELCTTRTNANVAASVVISAAAPIAATAATAKITLRNMGLSYPWWLCSLILPVRRTSDLSGSNGGDDPATKGEVVGVFEIGLIDDDGRDGRSTAVSSRATRSERSGPSASGCASGLGRWLV